jgi:hypothetical protein
MIIPIEMDEDDWERVCDILSTAADMAAEMLSDEDDEHVASELEHDQIHAARLYHYIGTTVGIVMTKSRDTRFRGPSQN